MKKKMNLNKSTKSTLITIGMVVVAYIVMTVLAQAGALSSLMKGLVVPLCIYAIIAVALSSSYVKETGDVDNGKAKAGKICVIIGIVGSVIGIIYAIIVLANGGLNNLNIQ